MSGMNERQRIELRRVCIGTTSLPLLLLAKTVETHPTRHRAATEGDAGP